MIIDNKIALVQFWRDNIRGCISFIYVDGNIIREHYKPDYWYTNDMPVLNYITITENEREIVTIRDLNKLDNLLKDKEIVYMSGDKSSLTIELKGKIKRTN